MGQGAVSRQEHSQEHGQGRRKDINVSRTGRDAADRGWDPRHRPEGKEERVRLSQGLGAGRGPRGKEGKGDAGPRGQAGRGMAAGGEGQGAARGTGSGARARQLDVRPVRCISSGVQQMLAHHADHQDHHHTHLYNIDSDAGDVVPPLPPDPPTSRLPTRTAAPRAAPLPRHESQGRSWCGWPVPRRRGVLARSLHGGARGGWAGHWNAVLDPLGGEAPPLVMEYYGWLSWATSGTTRGLTNRPFDAVLLRRDGGNREVPSGGWVARDDQERFLRAVVGAEWPHREPTWRAFLEGGALLRVTDAEANNWLPSRIALPSPTGAPAGRTRCPRSPSPHISGGAGDGRAQRLWSQAAGTGESERTSGAGRPPAVPGAPAQSDPAPPPPVRTARGHAPPSVGERAGATSTPTRATRGPLLTADH